MKPARLVETSARKSSAVYSVNGFTRKIPAFATTASIEPNFLRASSATFCAVSNWPMSPSINARWSEVESSLDFVAFRAVPTTLYPRARNARTIPAPMPCDAPVTITVLGGLFISLKCSYASFRDGMILIVATIWLHCCHRFLLLLQYVVRRPEVRELVQQVTVAPDLIRDRSVRAGCVAKL